MAEVIHIDKGRTGTITIIASDEITDDTLLVKLFATSKVGVDPEVTLVGDINSDGITIIFTYTHDTTKDLTVKSLRYEIVLYASDLTFVKNISNGLFYVDDVIKIDPTT